MRLRAALFALLTVGAVLLAPGAGAWAADGGVATSTALAKKPAMRARAPAKPMKALAPRLPVSMEPKASSIPPDLSQCRLDCAQAYYFCLAADDAKSCGGPWTSCLTACSRGGTGP